MLKTVSFSALHVGLFGSGSFRYGAALTVHVESVEQSPEIIPDQILDHLNDDLTGNSVNAGEFVSSEPADHLSVDAREGGVDHTDRNTLISFMSSKGRIESGSAFTEEATSVLGTDSEEDLRSISKPFS